jgi:phosphonopyruvate decarboxylase
MAGAMGAAVSIALGLALAQPDRRVLAVTGEGELLMNVGTLATVAVLNPGNLSILCIDNGHYGETGYQRTHTSFCTDLETVARGCGIANTLIVDDESGISAGAKLLRRDDNAGFVLLRARPTPPADHSRDLRPDVCRSRFRSALSA